MRKLIWAVVLLSSALIVPPATSAGECQRLEKFSFACTVGGCQQTIEVNRCKVLSVSSRRCEQCTTTIPCCGQGVCDASQPTRCTFAALKLLDQAKQWELTRLMSVYVPSCDGGLVSLKYVVDSQAKGQDMSNTNDRAAPSEPKHTTSG